MMYVDKLLQETEYLELLRKLELLEQDRVFCRHGLEHLLDTARIAWSYWLEEYIFQNDMEKSRTNGEQSQVRNTQECDTTEMIGEKLARKKEQIYLTALLHDLGRIGEYEEGVPHHQAGVTMAEELLEQIAYPKEEQENILNSIGGHRGISEDKGRREELKALLKWADKKSRNCFWCKAQKECKWSEEKRNRTIHY